MIIEVKAEEAVSEFDQFCNYRKKRRISNVS